MSTSVDQRSKGQQNQVSNGTEKQQQPHQHQQQADFDYMHGHPPPPPQTYGNAAQMNSPNAPDPYGASYYQHYMFSPSMPGQDAVGAPWSNGGDPMSLLGSYGPQVNGGDYSAMYTGFDYRDTNYSQFGWGFSGDFQTPWNAAPQQPAGGSTSSRKEDQQQQQHAYPTDPYYMAPSRDHHAYGGTVNGEVDTGHESVDRSMKAMTLNEGKGDHARESGHHHHSGSVPASSGGGSGGGSGSGGSSGGGGNSAPKKMSWASVASQPARPQPQVKPKSIPRAPLMPGKHGNMDIGMWDGKNNSAKGGPGGNPGQARGAWGAGRGRMAPPAPYSSGPGGQASSVSQNAGGQSGGSTGNNPATSGKEKVESGLPHHPVLEKLKSSNSYNPKEFNLNPKGARFFIIKSYSEDDIHRSIKYSIWCSTEHGNKRLDMAFREREGKGPIYFFFSVNGSGHFCGMAQMQTAVDYHSSSSVWAQDKWKGQMEVKWIYVKDVPNSQLRHIRLENNENKPVTNSRDTQEVPPEKGKQVLRIMHHYRHTTSIFDDFNHYEKRQEDEKPVEKPAKGSRDDRREDSRDDVAREEGGRRDDGRRDNRRGGDDRRGGRSNYH